MRRLVALAASLAAAVGGCGADDSREAEIASTLARADEALIRSRPALVAGKYERMRQDEYAFFRGTLPLWLHDWRLGTARLSASVFSSGGPLVPGLGDPHPENFGTLRAADGTLALEPNDFDSADRVPYLWDLRRLLVGLSLAVALSNPDDPAARATAIASAGAVLRAGATAYADRISELARGAKPERISDAKGEAVLDDLFSRSERDHDDRRELGDLTTLAGGKRALKRGVLDPAEPTQAFADLPASAIEALPDALARYRETLLVPPPAEYFTLLDAVREHGSGVASWPRIRAIALVRGPSDDPGDDVLLEVKELPDSGASGWFPPGVYADSVTDRVLFASRAAWARPDAAPLWGVTTWLGFPCQVRVETEGQKTLRVSRLEEERGTPEALIAVAARLGALLARVHAAAAGEIAGAIGKDRARFADEQVAAATSYASQVASDWPRFRHALEDLGPTLGVTAGDDDAPSADLAALYGEPPSP